MSECTWTETEEGNWGTSCGGIFEFMDGGPDENRMEFCPYCGKKLIAINYERQMKEKMMNEITVGIKNKKCATCWRYDGHRCLGWGKAVKENWLCKRHQSKRPEREKGNAPQLELF